MSRLHLLLSSALLLLLPCRAYSQLRAPADSSYAVERAAASFRPSSLIAPGVLVAGGASVHWLAHTTLDYGVRDMFLGWRGDSPGCAFDDYFQYLPVLADMGLGFVGAEARHDALDRILTIGIGAVALVAVTESVKLLVDSPRPDGSDNRSFPSGHAAKAFFGAELVRMEYGNWWGLGAYAVASAVGIGRLYNNEHWLGDVLTGAGVGIICAHVGEWLLEPVKDVLGIRTSGIALSPSVDPWSGTVCTALCFRF